MKNKVLALFVFLTSFSVILASQRDTLEITNDTHRDEGGSGRNLFLVWEGDVKDPPQHTENLELGQKDSRDSKYVKSGNNTRNFEITVYRWRDGEKSRIGKFIHGISNGPYAGGHTESTRIFKNYTADDVQLWREYYVDSGDSPVRQTAYIGSIPKNQW